LTGAPDPVLARVLSAGPRLEEEEGHGLCGKRPFPLAPARPWVQRKTTEEVRRRDFT
jgi:hypothetical protein